MPPVRHALVSPESAHKVAPRPPVSAVAKKKDTLSTAASLQNRVGNSGMLHIVASGGKEKPGGGKAGTGKAKKTIVGGKRVAKIRKGSPKGIRLKSSPLRGFPGAQGTTSQAISRGSAIVAKANKDTVDDRPKIGPGGGPGGEGRWGLNNPILAKTGQSSRAGHDLTALIAEAAARAKGEYVGVVNGQAGGLVAEASRSGGQLRTGFGTHIHTVRNGFASAHIDVLAAMFGAQAQVRASVEAALAALTKAQFAATADIRSVFSEGRIQTVLVGASYAGLSVRTGDEAARQLRTAVEHRAYQAWEIGGALAKSDSPPAIAEAKSRIAWDLANEAAGAILENLDEVEDEVRATGQETAAAVREECWKFSASLGDGEDRAIGQVWALFEEARRLVRDTGALGLSQLGELGRLGRAQLWSSEDLVVGQLERVRDRACARIWIETGKAIASLYMEAAKALAAADTQIERLEREIQRAKPPRSDWPTLLAGAAPGIGGAFHQLTATTLAGCARIGAAIAGFASGTLLTVGSAVARVSGSVKAVADELARRAAAHAEAVKVDLLSIPERAVEIGSEAAAQISGGIVDAVGQLGAALQKSLGDYTRELAEKIRDADANAREPLAELNQQILTAQSRIEVMAKTGWWDRQAEDLWEMVEDPGFLATLVVGIGLAALAIFLLPEGIILALGLAVAAGIALAVGSIVSQATRGRWFNGWDWSLVKWKQVGISFLIGFGAAAALAAMVIMFPAVGTVLGVTLATGGITIATNLITGERWDKGLLANMAFAGLFAKLGKYLLKEEGGPLEKEGGSGKGGESGKGSKGTEGAKSGKTTEGGESAKKAAGGKDSQSGKVGDAATAGSSGKAEPGAKGAKVADEAETAGKKDSSGKERQASKKDSKGKEAKSGSAETPTILVDDPRRIQSTKPKLGADGQLHWELYDSESGATFSWVHADRTGLGNPEQYLLPKEARMPSGNLAVLESKGRFSWTLESLKKNMEIWERQFGRKLETYGGEIADENLRNFQEEYVKAKSQNKGGNRQGWADAAIRRISFGKHRITLGFSDLRVRVEFWTKIKINGVEHEVPGWVEIEARRPRP
jgi:hypothetical protein